MKRLKTIAGLPSDNGDVRLGCGYRTGRRNGLALDVRSSDVADQLAHDILSISRPMTGKVWVHIVDAAVFRKRASPLHLCHQTPSSFVLEQAYIFEIRKK
jgi:hypothetical protein